MRRKSNSEFSTTGFPTRYAVRTLLAFLLPAFILLSARFVTAQEKVTLRKGLPAGKFQMRQEISFSQTVTFTEGSAVNRQRAQIYWNMEIRNASGGRTVLLRLMNIAFHTRSTVGTEISLGYDSEKVADASAGLKAIYRHLQNLRITVLLDSDLHPTEVRGLDGLEEFLTSDEIKNDPNAMALVPVILSLFAPEMVKGYFNQLYYLIPEEPVSVGESWTKETQLPLPEQKDLHIEWNGELKEVRGTGSARVAKIAGQGTISIPDAGEMTCNVENEVNVRSGLPVFVGFSTVTSRSGKLKIREEEEEVRTVISFRCAQTISE